MDNKDFSKLASSAQSVTKAESVINESRNEVIRALLEGISITSTSLRVVETVDEDNRMLLETCIETLSYMRETLKALIKTGF